MLYLKKISLINFKNYEDLDLEFSSRLNCFVGLNGSGKTNLLDAIHYLSFCKSYYNPIDSQNIKHKEDFMMIQGYFDKDNQEQTDEIHCGLKKNQKKVFKRNKKAYKKLSEHVGNYPIVMISPYDKDLISGGSELRRKFIDGVICQWDRNYLDTLNQYNKALAQRNALLKDFEKRDYFDKDSLEIWDMQMDELATVIHQKRKAFLEEFVPVFKHYFEKISNSREKVTMVYRSQLDKESLKDLFEQNLNKDRVMQYSTVGTHRDDLLLLMSGYPVKKYGSQGQQKSYSIAMKLAQFDFLKEKKSVAPVLLLDDIFDKLDPERVGSLLNFVSNGHFGQVFITDTDKGRLQNQLSGIEKEIRFFNVNQGKISSEEKTEIK